MSMTPIRRTARTLLATLLLTVVGSAAAHSGEGAAGGFVAGFLHPLSGLDHIVAMVAVGLWGAILGAPALWLLPVVFPMVMAFGGAIGVLGVPVPAVESGIALSGIVLGLMVACSVRPPLWIASLLVGCFAIFHGYAHGTELPDSANPLTFASGFVIATGLLHLGGIAFGLLVRWPAGRQTVRAAGACISATGFAFLLRLL